MSKVALVLEGGGMRGSFTSGLLDQLLEDGIHIQYVLGVSAGACNGANYLSRQMGRIAHITTRFIGDRRYISPLGLLGRRRSVFGMDFIFRTIPERLVPFDYDAFYASGAEMVIVTTDCRSGKALFHKNPPKDKLNLYLRASSSIPLVSPIVRVDGLELLDGGTADSVPVEYALSECDKAVVVTTRHHGYRKGKGPLTALYQAQYRRYPALVDTYRRRHELYNREMDLLDELEQKGVVFPIYPPTPIELSVFERDAHALMTVYRQGREQMMRLEPQLLNFLADADNVLYDRPQEEP